MKEESPLASGHNETSTAHPLEPVRLQQSGEDAAEKTKPERLCGILKHLFNCRLSQENSSKCCRAKALKHPEELRV